MSETKTVFAVSDIHGHYTLLKAALDQAGFDPKDPNHLLVCCGDYFDRGTENEAVLKYLDRLEHKVLLRGNHEEMLLEILQTGRLKPHNYLNGTPETIVEFFGKYAIDAFGNIDFGGKSRVADRLEEFMSATQNYFETAHFLFVHGWLPSSKPAPHFWRTASEEAWKKARWSKWTEHYDPNCRPAEKTLVCGHVPTFYATRFDPSRTAENADIFFGNGLTVLDGGTYTSGKLNVLVLKDEPLLS